MGSKDCSGGKVIYSDARQEEPYNIEEEPDNIEEEGEYHNFDDDSYHPYGNHDQSRGDIIYIYMSNTDRYNYDMIYDNCMF
jgi:hypothetical protein